MWPVQVTFSLLLQVPHLAQWAGWTTQSLELLASLDFCEQWTKSLNVSELWRLIYTVALLIPLLVAKRFGESESVWYTVTHYANMRADLYRTIMRINPEYYTLCYMCVWHARAFLHILPFCLPPTGLGGSTLTRCGGTWAEDRGTVLWWESILLVNADTSQTPITVSASKADIFIRMSYQEIYVPREWGCYIVTPCDVKYESLGGAVL